MLSAIASSIFAIETSLAPTPAYAHSKGSTDNGKHHHQHHSNVHQTLGGVCQPCCIGPNPIC
jgi:hypothetical protein